ncbi:hypothetical protein DBV15_01230 [Temnothorax longispinosus]|uniref:Uncharacterized protein n=1 Tax=Temnothorax longispinosus TaxID=300112 RepID=A0A4S2KJC7_9HYME|nr:hypothetical protein DBV15_01230 [Temnothorax longispinosus]
MSPGVAKLAAQKAPFGIRTQCVQMSNERLEERVTRRGSASGRRMKDEGQRTEDEGRNRDSTFVGRSFWGEEYFTEFFFKCFACDRAATVSSHSMILVILVTSSMGKGGGDRGVAGANCARDRENKLSPV